MEPFWVGIAAGYGIAVPVGAIAVLIVQVGMRCGFGCAASAGAGAATADLVYAVLAVTAGSALAGALEPVGEAFRWLSATVLAAIALHGLWGLWRERATSSDLDVAMPSPREYVITYARFVGLTIVNPMTIVYFTAFVFGMGLGDGISISGTGRLLFVAGAFLASLSWQTLLAGIGAFARQRLPDRFRVGAVVVGNLVVLAMAAVIALR